MLAQAVGLVDVAEDVQLGPQVEIVRNRTLRPETPVDRPSCGPPRCTSRRGECARSGRATVAPRLRRGPPSPPSAAPPSPCQKARCSGKQPSFAPGSARLLPE